MNTATSTLSLNTMFNLNDYIYLGSDNWYSLLIRINWLAFLLLLLIVIFLICFKTKKSKKSVHVEKIQLGNGIASVDITINKTVQEIAYKIWVELVTRKVAIQVEDNDVIVEVYDSWYAAFTKIRNLLKSVPGKSLNEASELIKLTIDVLNIGLRPHLTNWQAKFRKWYEIAKQKDINKSPQEIQKGFLEYNALVDNMKQTNQIMIDFANQLKKIAFDKNE